jgi:anti-sigma factor RsiW
VETSRAGMLGRDETRDLVAAADGTLPERRRAWVLARIAADPEARRIVEQQQRVRAALAGAQIQAPDSLRKRVESLHADADRRL